MTLDELLQELGAKDAFEVSIGNVPTGAAGSDWKMVAAEGERRTAARDRGDFLARCKGSTVGVSASQAAMLINAGARDER